MAKPLQTLTEIIMNRFFSVKAAARFVATTAFTVFSYAAMAQSAPSAETCGQAMSAFQQRLYAHFLAGPATLRNYVFSVRGVHLLDIYQVDAWARGVSARTCPEKDAATPSADEGPAAPAPASTASPVSSSSPVAVDVASSGG